MRTFPIVDFSGGWNPRDAWSQVADNESPDMLNMTIDERGGVVARLGLERLTRDQTDDVLGVLFYSDNLNGFFGQVGASLYFSAEGGTSWTFLKTFGDFSRCAIVDFLGVAVISHGDDGCYTYDGTTLSSLISNSPAGTMIAVWQNCLWSAGDPERQLRVTRSDLGAATWPASPVYVDIRSKDDLPIHAIGGGVGMDVLGRDGLLVWKEDSHYRINSPSTGAYTVESYDYGACGTLAVTTNKGVTCAVSKHGIVANMGSGSPPVLVSDKVAPLFVEKHINFDTFRFAVATNYRDRMLFSLTFNQSPENSVTLEYDPETGSFVPHDFGIIAATVYRGNTLASVSQTETYVAPVLYSADATNLYSVNPGTAATTTVGAHGLGVAIEGMAYDRVTGILYGVTELTGAPSRSKLVSFNRTTGAGTVVGTFPTNGLVFEDIAVHPHTGQMYGLSGSSTPNWGLYTINATAVTATWLGDDLSPPLSAAISSPTGGLAFDKSGVLYGTAQRYVVTLNTTTGLATIVDEISSNYNKDTMSFSDDDVAFYNYSGSLYSTTDLTDIDDTETTIGALTGDNAVAWVFAGAGRGRVFQVFKGATDDGVPIEARHQTRWFEPNRGNDCRFRRVNVNGYGEFDLYFKVNYDTGDGDLHAISITSDAAAWDDAVWDTDVFGSTTFQDYEHVFSLGHGRSFSIEVRKTSSTSGLGPMLLDVGDPEERGSFGIFGLYVDIQHLGLS